MEHSDYIKSRFIACATCGELTSWFKQENLKAYCADCSQKQYEQRISTILERTASSTPDRVAEVME